MKKLYFLLLSILFTYFSFGQTVLYQEDFETDTNGTNYNTSIPEFSDGFGDFFLRTDGTGIISGYQVANSNGNFYFAAMDLDGEGATLPLSLSTISIDVTGLTDVDFVILLAEDDDGSNQDWDDSDYVHITYSIDGGSDQNLIWIESELSSGTNGIPRIDTDFDGIGEGVEITSTFAEFVENIPLSSNSTIEFTIEYNLDSGDEDLAIDNIRVVDGFVAAPSITISAPSDASSFAPGTTFVDIEWTTSNLGGGETVDVTVNGSTFINQSSPFTQATTDGQTYNVTVELIDGGGIIASDMISFDVASYTQVASINALRGLADGAYAELTSEALVSYTRSSRNQKYIQDATGGILIDDAPGTITTTFNEGDGMTGLKGVLTNFNQLIQINPVEDISASSSSNTITPDVVSLSVIAANLNDYESKLVRVNNVAFADGNGINTFSSGTNYVINDGTASTFRTNFSEANYIDELIPDSAIDFLAIVGSFNGAAQVTARSLSDLTTLSTSRNSIQGFSLSPNPTSLGYINILSKSNSKMDVKVYDILGKQVINESLENNRLDVSKLKSGVYVLKASQDDSISTKKLVIQ